MHSRRLVSTLAAAALLISLLPAQAMAGTWSVPVSSQSASQSIESSEYFSLAQASRHLEKSEYGKALPYLTEAIEKDPTNVLANFHMGSAYMELAKTAEIPQQQAIFLELSQQAFERVLDLNPNLTLTYFKLGKIALMRGDINAAKIVYTQGLIQEPENAALMFNLARVYDQAGEKPQAIELYQKTLKLDPDFVFAYNNMGLLYEDLQDLKMAEQCYKQAIRHNKDYNLPRLNLANLYAANGEADKALKMFDEALAMEPDNSWTYFYLGNLQLRQGNYDLAVAAYNESIRLNPSHSTAYYLLAVSLAKLKRLDEAQQASIHYIQMAPNGEYAGEMKNLIFAAKFAQNNYVITKTSQPNP